MEAEESESRYALKIPSLIEKIRGLRNIPIVILCMVAAFYQLILIVMSVMFYEKTITIPYFLCLYTILVYLTLRALCSYTRSI